MADADVVDQDVDPTIHPIELGKHRNDIVRVAVVAAEGDGLMITCLDLARGLLGTFLVDVANEEVCSGLGQSARDGVPVATIRASAGHQRHPSRKVKPLLNHVADSFNLSNLIIERLASYPDEDLPSSLLG